MLKQLLLLLTAPLFTFAQTTKDNRQPGELIIKGMLNNMSHPVPYIYIIAMDGKKGKTDSVRVINNQYVINLSPNVTTMISLYSKSPSAPDIFDSPDRYIVTFFSEPATVEISSSDSISNAKISGSRANEEYKRYLAGHRRIYNSGKKLYEQYAVYKQNDDTVNLRRLKFSTDSLEALLADYTYQYLYLHPKSYLRAYLVSNYASSLKSKSSEDDIGRLEGLYDRLSKPDKESYYGKRAWRKLDTYKIPVGSMAPEFTQNDTLGHPVSLSSFRGKYVLLDFWASWCGPCRKENPFVVKAYHRFKDRNFTIVSISLDKPGDKDRWIKAINEDGLTWVHLSNLEYWNSGVTKLYKVASIPMNFLIDPEGKIVAKGLREEEVEIALEKFVK